MVLWGEGVGKSAEYHGRGIAPGGQASAPRNNYHGEMPPTSEMEQWIERLLQGRPGPLKRSAKCAT